MNDEKYKVWWALHVRASSQEKLSPEEQLVYDEGLKELESEEYLTADLAPLQEARKKIAALEAENSALQARRQKLDKEIVSLEARTHHA
jgi:predicted nuclease with TOPRIM domain